MIQLHEFMAHIIFSHLIKVHRKSNSIQNFRSSTKYDTFDYRRAVTENPSIFMLTIWIIITFKFWSAQYNIFIQDFVTNVFVVSSAVYWTYFYLNLPGTVVPRKRKLRTLNSPVKSNVNCSIHYQNPLSLNYKFHHSLNSKEFAWFNYISRCPNHSWS